MIHTCEGSRKAAFLLPIILEAIYDSRLLVAVIREQADLLDQALLFCKGAVEDGGNPHLGADAFRNQLLSIDE